jgi:hypothetical protein
MGYDKFFYDLENCFNNTSVFSGTGYVANQPNRFKRFAAGILAKTAAQRKADLRRLF